MQDHANYWKSRAFMRLNRRRFLRSSAVGAGGIATLGLVGCGDDDDAVPGGGTETPVTGSPTTMASPTAAPPTGQIQPSGDDLKAVEHFPLNYPAQGQPRRGGRLRMASPYDLAGLDPTKSLAGGVIMHVNKVYNRLVRFETGPDFNPTDFPGKVVPDLAASWETPDDRTLVFKLNSGVKWQDVAPLNGRAFTAEDVVLAYEAYKAAGPAATYLRLTDKIEAPDAATVRITLKEPFSDQLAYLASRYLTVFPRELADSGELATKAVGTGPMILKEARKGEQMVYDRNPNYFAGEVWLDGIDHRIVSSAATRDQLMRAGEVDFTPTSFDTIQAVKELIGTQPDIAGTRAVPISGRINLAMQLRKAPFNDVRVRRAVSLAVDLEKWGDLGFGEGVHYKGPNIPWGLARDSEPSFEDLGQWYGYDPGESKKLIDAAGVSGQTFELLYYPYRPNYDDFANLLLEDLRAVGLNVNIKKVDNVTFNAQWVPGTFTDFAFGWKAIPVASDDIFSGYYRSDSTLNRWGVNDPKVDALVDKQRRAASVDERREVWKEMWDLDLDQMYYFAMPDGIQFNVMSPKVQGLRFGWIQTNVADAYDTGQQLTHTWLSA